MRLLLETGKVDIDSKDKYSVTPLSYAASSGHEAVVRLLLETGTVNPDLKDNHGKTPLSYAMQEEHEPIVTLLESYTRTS